MNARILRPLNSPNDPESPSSELMLQRHQHWRMRILDIELTWGKTQIGVQQTEG